MATAVAAVTFDATGTLIHCPRLGEIYSGVLRRHGYDLEPDRARDLVVTVWQEFSLAIRGDEDRFAAHPQGASGWWQRFLERLCVHLGGPPPTRFAAAELFDGFARASAWQVFPDVEETLRELGRQGLRLAVIANWDERLPRLLGELGLAEHFETIVTSQAASVQKPHPLIFQTALGLLDLSPEGALHVGDRRLEDFEGAEAVGLQALWLQRQGGGDIESLHELLSCPNLQSSC